jgi:hypothetical protein
MTELRRWGMFTSRLALSSAISGSWFTGHGESIWPALLLWLGQISVPACEANKPGLLP